MDLKTNIQENSLNLTTVVREATYTKIQKPSCHKKMRLNTFPVRFINLWNSLSEEIVSSDTVTKFKTRLDRFLMPDRFNLAGTRQFIDKTTHREGFWRQFIDTIEDNPSTLFEDNSSTHYYLAIIPKLIK